MKCFITGATGFIGGSLLKRLIDEGYEVRGLIHEKKPATFEEKAEYVYGDIRNINAIRSYLNDIDFVFHCAALVKDYGSRKNFYDINVEGTKNLVTISKECAIKRFIFLSHINYEEDKNISDYRETKLIAEEILKREFRNNGFPMIILRPGNVIGPGATTWVLRPLEAIKKNRIALINHGKGIFHHTYIDNLLDAIIASLEIKDAVGKSFNITDGDHNVTWEKYFNDLAKIAGSRQIERNLSKKNALLIGKIMILAHKIFKIKPWITPYAVNILTNEYKVSIDTAKDVLGYEPKIDYYEGIKNIKKWLKTEKYI